MDFAYVKPKVKERLDVLKDRYYMYCRNENEGKKQLSKGSGAIARHNAKRDMRILTLISELLPYAPKGLELSDEAEKGYELLCEPSEKHRSKHVAS